MLNGKTFVLMLMQAIFVLEKCNHATNLEHIGPDFKKLARLTGKL